MNQTEQPPTAVNLTLALQFCFWLEEGAIRIERPAMIGGAAASPAYICTAMWCAAWKGKSERGRVSQGTGRPKAVTVNMNEIWQHNLKKKNIKLNVYIQMGPGKITVNENQTFAMFYQWINELISSASILWMFDMKLQEIFNPTANVWLMHETEDSLVRPVKKRKILHWKLKNLKWVFKVPLSSCVSCLGSNLTWGGKGNLFKRTEEISSRL